MTVPQTAFLNNFVFFFSAFLAFYRFFGASLGEKPTEKDGKEPERTREQGRTEQTSPTNSTEQSSRARRNERTARLAIRRELPEQMAAKGPDVESEACQLTRKAGRPRRSSQQGAEIIN